MLSPVLTNFSEATNLTKTGDNRYRVEFDRSWWVIAGPNGGIIAAVILKAAMAALPENRTARTITVHYLSAPGEGEAEIVVTVDKNGKNLSFVTVRLTQGDRCIATALVAVGVSMTPDQSWQQMSMPRSMPLEQGFKMLSDVHVAFRDRWDDRWTIGIPGHPETSITDGAYEVGGWTRLADPEPYDEAVILAMADSWVPSAMVHMDEAVHLPTIELTVHFLVDPRETGLSPEDHCFVVFRQLVGSQGFVDDTGEIWSPDGRLIATSRQIALLVEGKGLPVASRHYVAP